MKKTISILVLLAYTIVILNAQNQKIIPLPQKVEMNNGTFMLSKSTVINNSKQLKLQAYLQSQIQTLTGLSLSIQSYKKQFSTLKLTIDSKLQFGAEEYELVVSPKQCEIKAKTQNGLFYGIQSLLQLMPVNKVDTYQIPCQTINDAPRFAWRGMMLDVSRHFFPKAFVLKFIDLLAMHKMNTFHWHLVDDQGWRIEIKKYPKLTELGAWREDDTDKPWNYFQYPCNDKNKKLYGGFYTQEDIREIVKYASDRKITVVPEIEMPGHSTALLHAYPEISCTGKPWFKNQSELWEFSDPLCPGKEKTFEMLENILTEVMKLFPSKYIHVGGDESKKTTWAICPDCQQRMKTENIKHVDELQSYLIKRIEKFLVSKNRKLIGWDEILEGGIAPEATVMSWRGVSGGIEATKLGHEAVMSPSTHCYFDYPQIDGEKNGMGQPITLEKVYSYNPIDVSMTPEQAKLIKGAQANLWTEQIITEKRAEEMLLPRMSALSEVLWTQNELKNYPDFLNRLNKFFPRLTALNYNFFVMDFQD